MALVCELNTSTSVAKILNSNKKFISSKLVKHLKGGYTIYLIVSIMTELNDMIRMFFSRKLWLNSVKLFKEQERIECFEFE